MTPLSRDDLTQLLRHAGNNGVYHLPTSGRDLLAAACAEAELTYYLADLEDSDEAEDALALFGEALNFPEWYGANFDALHDCLSDLTWQDSAATVIVLTGCDALQASDPEAWETLLEVLREVAAFWREEETPFWVFVDMRADGLAELPTLAT